MDYYADLTCVLKVNSNCLECKEKVVEVLRSIRGVYNITIDAKQGIVKVTGKVDPNILLMVLANSGKHAEILWVQLENDQGTTTTEYQSYNRDQRALPSSYYHSQPPSLTAANYHSPAPLLPASYFPQAPMPAPDPSMHSQDDPICCSVM